MEFFLLLFGIFLILPFLVFWQWKKIHQNRKKKWKELQDLLPKISVLPANQKILEYDKILDKTLEILGYTGTTGEKIKKYGKNFGNQNNIWSAHKLRNRIAHEMGFVPTASETQKAEKIFVEELQKMWK